VFSFNFFTSTYVFLSFYVFYFSFYLFIIYNIKCVFICLLGIGGQGDMKLIYGTTVARKKAKAEKEDKVRLILCEHSDSHDD